MCEECIVPSILNPVTKWRCLLSFTLDHFYTWEVTPLFHLQEDWVCSRAGMYDVEQVNIVTLSGFEFQSLGKPQFIYHEWFYMLRKGTIGYFH